jgi:hypothetical protein
VIAFDYYCSYAEEVNKKVKIMLDNASASLEEISFYKAMLAEAMEQTSSIRKVCNDFEEKCKTLLPTDCKLPSRSCK